MPDIYTEYLTHMCYYFVVHVTRETKYLKHFVIVFTVVLLQLLTELYFYGQNKSSQKRTLESHMCITSRAVRVVHMAFKEMISTIEQILYKPIT